MSDGLDVTRATWWDAGRDASTTHESSSRRWAPRARRVALSGYKPSPRRIRYYIVLHFETLGKVENIRSLVIWQAKHESEDFIVYA